MNEFPVIAFMSTEEFSISFVLKMFFNPDKNSSSFFEEVLRSTSSLNSPLYWVRSDKLSSMLSTICLLGTVTYVFCSVRILVLRRPILSTFPVIFCTFTTSPVVNGLSKKMTKEAIRFSRLSLNDNAIAAPTMLKPVNTFPTSMLRAK